MKIRILDEAKNDLVEGFRFYEKQADGLGDYFLDSLYADIDSLQLYAGIHEKAFEFHRMLAKTFPFAVYYDVDGEVVSVYAVLDCRRSPSWTRNRLQ